MFYSWSSAYHDVTFDLRQHRFFPTSCVGDGVMLDGLAAVVVQAGPIAVDQCQLHGVVSSIVAGNVTLKIAPRDAAGNVITDNPQVKACKLVESSSTCRLPSAGHAAVHA